MAIAVSISMVPSGAPSGVAFRGVFIDELNEEHVTKWFADLSNRTGPGAANRTLEILKNMLIKAEVWGYRLENTNPCRSVRPNKRRQCTRFLSVEELARFGNVLADLRGSNNLTIRSGCTVITLLLLSGGRYRKILALQWQDVKGNRLLLRDSKTGQRMVGLGSAARVVIDSLPRHPKIPWLFRNYLYRRPMKSVQHLCETISDRPALGKLRIHDLCHTFASHGHLDNEHLLDAAQQIGDAAEHLMGAPLKSCAKSDIS
jgi:integrase